MTHEEISQNLADWYKENDERIGISITAELDGEEVKVNSQIHGVVYMLSNMLVELMKTDKNLYNILKGAVMMMDRHEQKKSNYS